MPSTCTIHACTQIYVRMCVCVHMQQEKSIDLNTREHPIPRARVHVYARVCECEHSQGLAVGGIEEGKVVGSYL